MNMLAQGQESARGGMPGGGAPDHDENEIHYALWLRRFAGGGAADGPPMWVQINEQDDTYHVWYHIPTQESIRLRKDGAWVTNTLQQVSPDTTAAPEYSFSLTVGPTRATVAYGARDQKLDLETYPDVRELMAKIQEDPFYRAYLTNHNIHSECAKRSQEDCTATGCIWLDGRMQRWSECRNLEEVCREREKGKTGMWGIVTDGVGGIFENSDNLARIEKMCHMDGLQERQRKYRIGTAAAAAATGALLWAGPAAVASGAAKAAGTALTGAKKLLGLNEEAPDTADAAARGREAVSQALSGRTADPPPHTKAESEVPRFTDRTQMEDAVHAEAARQVEVIEAKKEAAQAREEVARMRDQGSRARAVQTQRDVLFGP